MTYGHGYIILSLSSFPSGVRFARCAVMSLDSPDPLLAPASAQWGRGGNCRRGEISPVPIFSQTGATTRESVGIQRTFAPSVGVLSPTNTARHHPPTNFGIVRISEMGDEERLWVGALSPGFLRSRLLSVRNMHDAEAGDTHEVLDLCLCCILTSTYVPRMILSFVQSPEIKVQLFTFGGGWCGCMCSDACYGGRGGTFWYLYPCLRGYSKYDYIYFEYFS